LEECGQFGWPVDREGLDRALTRLNPRHRAAFIKAEDSLATLENLFHLAREFQLDGSGATAPLVDALRGAIDASPPPGRPRGFGLDSIRYGGVGLVIPLEMPGARVRCLVQPKLFRPLARAIVRLALEQDPVDMVDDSVWAGLWAVFDLYYRLEPLALVHRTSLMVEGGQDSSAGLEPTVAIAASECARTTAEYMDGCSVSLAGSLPLRRFPGNRDWFDHCRARGWAEAEEAIRSYCMGLWSWRQGR
jgi:hypothetical protein